MAEKLRAPGVESRREFLERLTAAGVVFLSGGLALGAPACARTSLGAERPERLVPEGSELLYEPIVLKEGDRLEDRSFVVSKRFRSSGDAIVRVAGDKVRIRNVRIVGGSEWEPRWNDWHRRAEKAPGMFGRTAGIRIENVRDVSVVGVQIEGLPRSAITGMAVEGGQFRDIQIYHCFHGIRLRPPKPNRDIHIEQVHARDLWGPGPGHWPGVAKNISDHGGHPSRARPGGFIGGDGLVLNTLRDSLVSDCTATGELFGAFKMTNPQTLEVRRLRGANIQIKGTAGSREREWAIHKSPARDIHIHDCVFDKGIGWGACPRWANCIQVSQNVEKLLVENCILDGGERDGHAIQLSGNAHAVVIGCTIRGFGGVRGPNPAHAVDLANGSTINDDFETLNRFVDQQRIRLDRNPKPRGRPR